MKSSIAKFKTLTVQWTKQKPRYSSQPVNNEKHEVSQLIQRLVNKTETELFQEFFDAELMEYITDPLVSDIFHVYQPLYKL